MIKILEAKASYIIAMVGFWALYQQKKRLCKKHPLHRLSF